MIRAALIIALFFLQACALTSKQTQDPKKPSVLNVSNCLSFYSSFDEALHEENIRDVQASAVEGYPYLQINRFLASFKSKLESNEKRGYWLSLLADLNNESRRIEWKNLREERKNYLTNTYFPSQDVYNYLRACSDLLIAGLSAVEKRQVEMNAEVYDDYSTMSRVFGVYPLTSLVVSHQINKHQKLTRLAFKKPLAEIPVKGKLTRYGVSASKTNLRFEFDRDNPLAIPRLKPEYLALLFQNYAPILEVDEEDENDQVGRIQLDIEARAQFSNDQPLMYVLPSYVKFNNKILLQLNYIFWFASRPQKSAFDIYSGNLDGLIWRVTLDDNAEPILFDSVHDCGCYHKFYIGEQVEFKQAIADQEREPPFVAQHIKIEDLTKQVVIRISSVAHFVERIYFESEATQDFKAMQIKPYASLRSLPWNKQRRSMFASDGLVEGTARSERWMLWPMGVPSAGAMRQWGHHAVAFVGKRYFDDANLLDKYFSTE